MLDRRRIRDHRGHHPWLTVGHMPDWSVEHTSDLPPHHLGLTIHAEKRILIRDDLDVATRRATICHEVGHLLRGQTSDCHSLYEESLVERQAARLLMPSVRRLGHAMAWHQANYTKTADEMWVDEKLLNARLSTLAPAERQYLDEQLAMILI